MDLAQYLRQMLDQHPGVSDRQAAIQAGLANNAVTQITNYAILKPRPETLEALAKKWGTSEDYENMMQLAGYKVSNMPNKTVLSIPKQRVVNLLTQEEVTDDQATIVALVLEQFIQKCR